MTDLSPEDFDITQWLGNTDPDAYRNTETVTVYLLDPELTAEIEKVKHQYNQALAAEKNAGTGQLAVGEAKKSKLLEARMDNLLAQVEERRREVQLVGLIGPEITEASTGQDGKPLDGHHRDYALIAASARIKGHRINPAAVAILHRAIGEGQWSELSAAYRRVTYGKPGGGITAPFSPRS